MRSRKVAIVCACIGLTFGGCAARTASEKPAERAGAQAEPVVQGTTPVVEVTAGSLNIRAAASATGSVVGTLKRGDRARAPRPEEAGWLYIESDSGAQGYVASQYVRVVAAAAAPATPPAAAPAVAPAPSPAAKSTAAPAPKGATPAPPGSKLARITKGMSEGEVIGILGPPTSQRNSVSGNAFNPFAFGRDTTRLHYLYKGLGAVSFSRNGYSGRTTVVSVSYDPNEDGYP